MNNRRNEISGVLLCITALFIFASFFTYNPLETPSTLKAEIAKQNIKQQTQTNEMNSLPLFLPLTHKYTLDINTCKTTQNKKTNKTRGSSVF